MIPGDPAAWHIGIPLLIAVVGIVGLVLRRDRRPATIAVALAAALLVLVMTALRARYASPAMGMSSMQSASGVAPVPVTTAIVRRATTKGDVRAPGNVAPYLTQDVVARAPGLITGLSVYTGDHVRAGEVIARLDEAELRYDADAAVAAERSAERAALASTQTAAAVRSDVSAKRAQRSYWADEIQRERSLFEQGAVSAQEYQDERAQAAAASAAYDSARSNAIAAAAQASSSAEQVSAAGATARGKETVAGYASVVIPDDGVVVKRLVDPGVYVAAGTPIVRIASIDRLRIQAQVAQQDLEGISAGTPLDAVFDSGRTMHGRVSSVSPIVDPSTHTASVEAIVANSSRVFQPGGYVRVILHPKSGASDGAVAVPSAAVVGGARACVWTVVNGAAHRVPVTVTSDDGTTARIRGALRDGSRIVVEGASNLEEGDAVTEAMP